MPGRATTDGDDARLWRLPGRQALDERAPAGPRRGVGGARGARGPRGDPAHRGRGREQAGLEVLGSEVLGTLDPRAVRTIPAHFGAVAVGLVDGFLVVAFPGVPNPTVVQEIGATVGIPLRLVVVPGEIFDELGAEAARKREFVPVELDAILADAAARHASDVHLSAGAVPLARVRGALVPLDGWPLLSAEDTRELARSLAGDVVTDPDWPGDLQTAVSLGGRRLRASIYRQRQAHALALRISRPASPGSRSSASPASSTTWP